MHSLTLSLCVKNCRKASFNNGGGNLHLIHLRRSKCEDENNEKQQGMVDQRRDGGPGPNNLDWRTGPKQSRLVDLAQTISNKTHSRCSAFQSLLILVLKASAEPFTAEQCICFFL